MTNPCNLCIEKGRCSQEEPDLCGRKRAFIRYKEKCKEISEKTKILMEEAKKNASNR